MADPYYTPRKTILLTGAGFSKPFGGYLASEMWSIILNQPLVAESKRLREFLLGDLSFEHVYDKILSDPNLSPAEKQAFTTALVNAYGELDESIRSEHINRRPRCQMIRYFLSRFGGLGRERGFIFTLNQDLLLERLYSNEDGLLQIPAIGHEDWFTPRLESRPAPECMVPDSARIESFRQTFWEKGSGLQNFLYLKLHGSYAWKSRNNTMAMVIGYEKAGSIANEPLLQWYLDVFKKILNIPGQTLVIVGYGFMDRHINETIADAAKNGLTLHIISPMQPRDFKNVLVPIRTSVGPPVPRGKDIWEMLRGYHCISVDDMIPTNASTLPARALAFFKSVNLE